MDSSSMALLNQLTLAAAAIVACGFLWRRLVATQDAANKARDDFQNTVVYDLKARIMVVEDKLEIDRQDRFKYLPPLGEKEVETLVNLDGDTRRK